MTYFDDLVERVKTSSPLASLVAAEELALHQASPGDEDPELAAMIWRVKTEEPFAALAAAQTLAQTHRVARFDLSEREVAMLIHEVKTGRPFQSLAAAEQLAHSHHRSEIIRPELEESRAGQLAHTSGSALIELRNVRKEYRRDARRDDLKTWALDDVTLTIERGDFLAVYGTRGSGKTTLLHLLGGLDRPTAGSIFVDGKEISALSASNLATWRARHVGFIFANNNLIPELDLYRNVEVPLLLTNLSRKERERIAMAALDGVGLANRSRHQPYELTEGQVKRVALARAMVTDPTLMLIDEPTWDLDSRMSEAFIDLLRDVNERLGITIVFATDDIRIAVRAQHRANLDKGQLVHTNTEPDEHWQQKHA